MPALMCRRLQCMLVIKVGGWERDLGLGSDKQCLCFIHTFIHIYIDRRLTGHNPESPGLCKAK